MTTIVNATQFNVAYEEFQALKSTRITVPGMGSYNKLGDYVPAYVEIGVIVALLVVIVLFIVLRWTKIGRGFYAIGGNSQSASMLGIKVKRTKFTAYVLCGLLAGIGEAVCFVIILTQSPDGTDTADHPLFHTNKGSSQLLCKKRAYSQNPYI